MTPEEHLDWFEDNIAWYEAVAADQLVAPVPACPGWNVEFVLNHLSFGLGVAYPFAMSKDPETAHEHAFDGVTFPPQEQWPTGTDAAAAFAVNMRECLSAFRGTPPDRPGYTYAGPGVAGFWFRRAAVETAIHLMDVATAIDADDTPLSSTRAADGVAEGVAFALPIAAEIVGRPTGRLVFAADGFAPVAIGDGPAEAVVSGRSEDLLAVLWGRTRPAVGVTGAPDVAEGWLTLAERAFAGR